ncbi:hypothetical protein CLOM_g10213 [Closterium sp. NIES-68]|nr:hypothetical protein CLOM_g10213 [Closterium sp. NIES-68]
MDVPSTVMAMNTSAAAVHVTSLTNLMSAGGTDIAALTLFISLLCACIVVGHILEDVRWINESVTAIIFGLVTGGIVLLVRKGKSSLVLRFDEDLFFIYLLPPIIFNAGFQVKKKQFFRNFGAIMAYGIVGVFISFGVISAGCRSLFDLLGLPPQHSRVYLALGVIFSATDSVCTLQVLDQGEQPLVYSLVFGEGVVNDATSIVLFRAVQKLQHDVLDLPALAGIASDFLYLFTASTALGIAFGLASAFIIRKLYFVGHATDREVALMALMAYLSYVLSEVLELSGILSVFFAGIVMSHYTWHNVTESSRVTTKHAFATMSFIAETFIFIYVGMDALDVDKWSSVNHRNAGVLFGILLSLVLLGRAAFVFPLSFLLNLRRKNSRVLLPQHQVVIWWAGLIRGAVSIALTYSAFPDYADPTVATTIAATIALVLFSTVVFGLLTSPLINHLLPRPLDRSSSLISDALPSPKYLYYPPSLPRRSSSSSLSLALDIPPSPLSCASGLSAPPRPHHLAPHGTSHSAPSSSSHGVSSSRPSRVLRFADPPVPDATATAVIATVATAAAVGEGSAFAGFATGAAAAASSSSVPVPPLDAVSCLPPNALPGLTMPDPRFASRLLSARESDVHDLWRWFDDSYMRPMFGGRGFVRPFSSAAAAANAFAPVVPTPRAIAAAAAAAASGAAAGAAASAVMRGNRSQSGEGFAGLRVSLTDRLLAEGGEVRGVEEEAEGERFVSGGVLGNVLRFGAGEWEGQGDDGRRSSSGWWSLSEEGGRERDSGVEKGGRKEEEGDAIEGEDLADCDAAWPARLQSPRPHASPSFHSRPSPDR